MKDKVSRIHARSIPYNAVTPRRALHEVVGTTQGGKVVRQANSTIAACSLPQTVSGVISRICTEQISASVCRSFSVEHSEEVDPNNPNLGYRSWTCAKVACDNNRDKITIATFKTLENGDWLGCDTRCFVTRPPYTFTTQLFDYPAGETYDGLPGTRAGVAYSFPGYQGVVVDTDVQRCYEARTNATAARQLQAEFNITAEQTSSQPINILPTINPGLSINTPINSPVKPNVEQTSSTSSASLLATAGAGLLSTAAAFITPTPTAVIAAAAPNATVTGLAVGLGVLGSGVLITGAAYGGYKLTQHFAKHEAPTANGFALLGSADSLETELA